MCIKLNQSILEPGEMECKTKQIDVGSRNTFTSYQSSSFKSTVAVTVENPNQQLHISFNKYMLPFGGCTPGPLFLMEFISIEEKNEEKYTILKGKLVFNLELQPKKGGQQLTAEERKPNHEVCISY